MLRKPEKAKIFLTLKRIFCTKMSSKRASRSCWNVCQIWICHSF